MLDKAWDVCCIWRVPSGDVCPISCVWVGVDILRVMLRLRKEQEGKEEKENYGGSHLAAVIHTYHIFCAYSCEY